jgi:hypothetical protein
MVQAFKNVNIKFRRTLFISLCLTNSLRGTLSFLRNSWSQIYAEFKGSLSRSQQPTTGPCPGPIEPLHTLIPILLFSCYPSIYSCVSTDVYSHQVFRLKSAIVHVSHLPVLPFNRPDLIALIILCDKFTLHRFPDTKGISNFLFRGIVLGSVNA